MSEDEAFRLVHMLSLFLFLAGLGATLLPLYRAWGSKDVHQQTYAFEEAGRNQTGVLLPGAILVGVTGVIWAIRSEQVDPIDTGWLVALEGLYLVILFFGIPALAAGLRRVRLLALQARKTGQISPEFEEILQDRAPIVVGTFIALLVPAMAALAILQPF